MTAGPTNRCIFLGLALFALTIGVRWVTPAAWPEPWRWQPLVSLMHGERDAILVGLHVAAMAVLTTGVLGVQAEGAMRICAFWSLSGGVLELIQHPTVADAVMSAFPDSGVAGRIGDLIELSLSNGRFSQDELAASLAGGWLAFLLIRRIERSALPHAAGTEFQP